jgi:hypothetical protein
LIGAVGATAFALLLSFVLARFGSRHFGLSSSASSSPTASRPARFWRLGSSCGGRSPTSCWRSI